ncbi:MAG: hypothetical protein LAO31_03225 [Acidobacteriia bacterium]|nr:hypothetical protein [Terriglobia bacterium]
MKLFNSHRVEYLLIGGYAVAYHGYPRATADMDVWIATNPPNEERVVAALKDFGFDLPTLSTDVFLKDHPIVRMGLPLVGSRSSQDGGRLLQGHHGK